MDEFKLTKKTKEDNNMSIKKIRKVFTVGSVFNVPQEGLVDQMAAVIRRQTRAFHDDMTEKGFHLPPLRFEEKE